MKWKATTRWGRNKKRMNFLANSILVDGWNLNFDVTHLKCNVFISKWIIRAYISFFMWFQILFFSRINVIQKKREEGIPKQHKNAFYVGLFFIFYLFFFEILFNRTTQQQKWKTNEKTQKYISFGGWCFLRLNSLQTFGSVVLFSTL